MGRCKQKQRRLRGLLCRWPSITEWEMYITAQGCRLRIDLYCVEWDVKLYCTIPYLMLLFYANTSDLSCFWILLERRTGIALTAPSRVAKPTEKSAVNTIPTAPPPRFMPDALPVTTLLMCPGLRPAQGTARYSPVTRFLHCQRCFIVVGRKGL